MSVRDTYRSTVAELRRADSIPERITVFRRVWAWLICKSRNSTTVFGIFLIPVYLIAIGVWKFEECGSGDESLNISLWLILTGSAIFICALYLPIRRYAKKRAIEARGEERVEKVSEEEIARFVPGHMDRICNLAFFALCAILPTLAIWLFRTDASQCAPIVYWTAFVVSVIYCVWLASVLLACCLCCCVFMTWPFCMAKCVGGTAEEEAV